MSDRNDVLVWIDTETTGVDPYAGKRDRLLEVACRVTDPLGNLIDDGGYHAVIKYTAPMASWLKAHADKFVQDMHERTGLWDRIQSDDAVSERVADHECLEYVKRYARTQGDGRLAGNSVRLDRNFMDVYMPLTSDWLHYRIVDNSSTAYLLDALYGEDTFITKKKNHDAYGDIMESIAEYQWQLDIIRQGGQWHRTV
jgi:oligoribonuclease